MRGIDERGKAPMAIFSAIEGDITDDSPTIPAVGVEGPGQSSRSVVAHTRSKPQASSVSSSRRMRHTSVLDLQQELFGRIAERLSPTDLLSMSQTHPQMSEAITGIATLRERRKRASRVQAIWNRLTQDRPGVENRLAPLLHGDVIQSLAPNFNYLTWAQQENLVALAGESRGNRRHDKPAHRSLQIE
ncbi:hypothetical protein BPNPMPFG_006529 (plasmid) [Mesorhizobium sp. AR07]|uniref:hypothetical protein n=1 Tax=Mesorhizobium sp. AR07 TaxID=2865838 RepID=UPI00215FDFA0|nr:hypothetical protein [Mesorhizobium sp. AR07]UVK48921.1 hypothetical protein BPNPMPFG_006529 [Mesorhizobium sp. AR07]